jgi:CDP-glucose 4,6-dehydratase
MNTKRSNKTNHANWRDRRVLVTGATGLVGSQLVHRLVNLGAETVCFVRDQDPASALWSSDNLAHVSVANGRLESFEQVKSVIIERDIDTIFHLGAQAIVGAGRRDPLGTFESNIRGTYHLLEACRLYGDQVKRIVIASSDKAYGECEALPYTEDTPLSANNPYDVSKSCADLISQSYFASYRLPIAIARCGNIFGPGDLHWSRLIPGTIRSTLNGAAPQIRSDGTLVRDYLYVNDAADAYLSLACWLDSENNASDSLRAFNFSSGKPLSVLEMTQMILRACGRADLQPVILNSAVGEISAQHLDSTRARHTLRWSADTSLTAALDTTVEWYRHYLHRFDPHRNPLPMPKASTLQARASA